MNHLDVSSPEILIAEGKYPLHGLRLYDADVAIDLRGAAPDTAAVDTTPLLLAFDIPDGELRNIHYAMTPLNLDIRTGSLSTEALVDVGANVYDARRIEIGGLVFGLNQLRIPTDTIYGNAFVNLAKNQITSEGLHVRSDEMGATANLYATEMNLETMRVEVTGDAEYQGSKANLRASYDIDDEAYDASVHIERINLAPFLQDETRVVLAGDIEAQGKGIDPKRPMVSRIQAHLDEAVYGPYNLSHTTFKGATDSITSLALTMPGVKADVHSPMPLMTLIDRIQPLVQTLSDSAVLQALTLLEDLTVLDTIRQKIPALKADLTLRRGSPIQALIDSTGLDFDKVALALRSDSLRTTFRLSPLTLSFPDTMRLPAVKTSLDLRMAEGLTNVSFAADTRLTDGAMSFDGLCTDASFRMDLMRVERDLHGGGKLSLDSIVYGDKELGNHAVDIRLSPSESYAHALRADIHTEDIPLELMNSFVTLTDIDLEGAVRASATVDRLKCNHAMSLPNISRTKSVSAWARRLSP